MREIVCELLTHCGEASEVRECRPVSGGDISRAVKAVTKERSYFVKFQHDVPNDFFEKEARGLKLLTSAQALSVPKVFGYRRGEDGTPAGIVMEWVEPSLQGDEVQQGEALGRGLAAMHRQSAEAFGWETDNYIGRLPQPNGWEKNWAVFYGEKRLYAQLQHAQKSGAMPAQRRRRLETLIGKLDAYLDKEVRPSLLHGDLWGGNWIASAGGKPYLIDPAVSYGDREMEIAFTRLFGGFPASFYDAYRESYPLKPDWEERAPLYQLYYLLVHLTLFGEAYGASVDRILHRYA